MASVAILEQAVETASLARDYKMAQHVAQIHAKLCEVEIEYEQTERRKVSALGASPKD